MASTQRSAKIVIGGLLLSVPVLLAVLALPRFLHGVAAEPFHRVIDSAELGETLPAATYRDASNALAGASADDGESLYERAQLLVLSAQTDPPTIAQSRILDVSALRAEPSNPSAWLLLCQIDALKSPSAADTCLANAFAVGPYDWYTADRRMLLVAKEWPYLDDSTRNKAVGLVLPMWTLVWPINNATLRGVLYQLSFTEDGRQLLRAGFEGHRNDLREFNRYIIEENTYGQ
jgi:hypothetical protein